MIGEDDRSVALGNASHGHMEDTMRSLDVMLLQPQRRSTRDALNVRGRTHYIPECSALVINVTKVVKYFLVKRR